MPEQSAPLNVSFVLELTGFDLLLQSLRQHGYRIIGPRLRDGAIVYDELTAASDLPIGWTDEQEGGTYRLKKGTTKRCLVLPSVRIPGNNFSIRPPSAFGKPRATPRDSHSNLRLCRAPSWRCLESGRASCTPSPSKTTCF